MRIWIVHQNAYAPSHSASTRHYELSRELIKRGHEVLIIASSFYHKDRCETRLRSDELWKYETINGVQYLWLKTPPYKSNGIARLWNMLVFTFRALKRHGLDQQPKPDLVIGSSPHLFSPFAAMRIAASYCVPFVLEIRDMWPSVPIEMGGMSRWHPLMLLMAWLEKFYYRKASKVISILPFASGHIQETIGRSDHVEWVPNGSPLDEVSSPSQHSNPLTFMYAGAHSVYSGLDVLIDAAQILEKEQWSDNVRIRLVGDGTEKLRLMKRVEDLGIEMISFEPPVPKSEVFNTLQSADAFLMIYKDTPLMRWGLCPNKLYDYMGASRPVVFGMATPNNPVEDSNSGISVKPQDAKSLADGIKRIALTDYETRVAMGTRGRKYVEDYHNFSVLGDKLEAVLLDVVNDQTSNCNKKMVA